MKFGRTILGHLASRNVYSLGSGAGCDLYYHILRAQVSTMEKYFSMMGLEHWGKSYSNICIKSSAFNAAESMTRIF